MLKLQRIYMANFKRFACMKGLINMQEKKKVGILTFSYSSNGGSVMQALALQKTISSFEGYDASIINYTKTHYGKPIFGKDVFTKPISAWTPKNIIRWTTSIVAHPFKMRNFENFFRKHYNNFSNRSYSREELVALNDVYDKFVVGSDQVWNFGSPQVDGTYFLDFVKNNSKKISYAASFGQNNVPEEKREQVSKFIADFSSVSVRESNGINIVSELTSRNATLVLDPSLLLSKEEYHKLSVAPKKKGYVYLYLRQESKSLEKFAEKLAKAYGLSVVKVLNSWICNKSGKQRFPIGPCQWLGYIENADFVVTNSFYGICFSTIFEKEFYVDFLEKTTTSTNSRLEGILQQFNLSKRCIDEVEDINSLTRIDYNDVNKFRQIRIKESLDYLKKALEGNN